MVKFFITVFLCFCGCVANAQQPVSSAKDSSIVLDSLQQLPKNIQQIILKGLSLKNKQGQTVYTIKGCYLYRQQLFLPVGTKQKSKILKPLPDACSGNFISLSGIACASSGCITGMGNGACSGMLASKQAALLTIVFLVGKKLHQ